jgi:hypothetical protein
MYFDEWDPSKHICEDVAMTRDWARWVTIDWGFSDPFSAVVPS